MKTVKLSAYQFHLACKICGKRVYLQLVAERMGRIFPSAMEQLKSYNTADLLEDYSDS